MLDDTEIETLNKKYIQLSVEQRFESLYQDFNVDEVMSTSSFGNHSALMLKTLSSVAPNQLIYFIDTGNHFNETHQYREELGRLLDLNIKVISTSSEIHRFTRKNKTWESNSTYCCYLKKVRPLENIVSKHKVWISGLMKWQSDHRSSLNVFEVRRGILKFFPLIDQTLEQCDSFIDGFNLPRHALVNKGYDSIGCTHCTHKGSLRIGRWKGSKKTECGLHL